MASWDDEELPEFIPFDLDRMHPEGAPGSLQRLLGDRTFEIFVARQKAERLALLTQAKKNAWRASVSRLWFYASLFIAPAVAVEAWRWVTG